MMIPIASNFFVSPAYSTFHWERKKNNITHTGMYNSWILWKIMYLRASGDFLGCFVFEFYSADPDPIRSENIPIYKPRRGVYNIIFMPWSSDVVLIVYCNIVIYIGIDVFFFFFYNFHRHTEEQNNSGYNIIISNDAHTD